MFRGNIVFLHLGIYKTGSTSIQKTLRVRKNRKELARQGVHVIKSLPANHSEFLQNAFGDRPEAYVINKIKGRSLEVIRKIVSIQKTDLYNELDNLKEKKIVFTGEAACNLSLQGFYKLRSFISELAGNDAKIIVLAYTRNPITYVASAVKQNVKKTGLTIEMASNVHIKGTRNRYRKLFRKCAEVFGSEHIRFRSFEQACRLDSGLIGDFFNNLGVDAFNISKLNMNKGIATETVFFLSYLNSMNIGFSADDLNLLEKVSGVTDGILNHEQKERVKQLATEDIIFLKQKFKIDYSATMDTLTKDHEYDFFSKSQIQQLCKLYPNLSRKVQNAFKMYVQLPETVLRIGSQSKISLLYKHLRIT